jgi:hypothetical protein
LSAGCPRSAVTPGERLVFLRKVKILEKRFGKSLLDPWTFSVTWELVPGRGAREKAQENALAAAAQAAKGGRIHALTITDNPGGNPAILADYLGSEILRLGIEPLVHFTCKDRNRNQIESELYALTDVAYRCPMSRCPKNQRNGACGGSFNGWCEVHSGKRRCVYVAAYARLKHYGEESRLDGEAVSPCNWDFYQTSSWINFYLGRDHTARRLGIPEVKKEGENIC